MITIDTNGGESKYPRINISKDYFPDYKIIAGAYNNFKNKRRKQNLQELVIKENLSGDIEKYNNIK